MLIWPNIPLRYILNYNFRCIQFFRKCLYTRINKIWRIIIFFRIVFEWLISKWNVLKSQHMLTPLWSNAYKINFFGTLEWNSHNWWKLLFELRFSTLSTNLPFLPQTLTSTNESYLNSSCAALFMFWCLKHIYSRSDWTNSGDSKRTTMLSRIFYKTLF